MKDRSTVKNMGRIHDRVVDRILADHRPDRHIAWAWAQWFLWLGLSVAVIGMVFLMMGLPYDAGLLVENPTMLAFFAAAFAGAALAAWEAIASSIPGRGTRKGYKFISSLALVLLVLIPFLFFYPVGRDFDLAGSFFGGIGCILRGSMLGVVPWVALGWMLSRNASFRPAWTGAWAGVSSFLIGTIAVQFHCPLWDAHHLLVAHLLPVALCVFIVTFLGAHWFARWKR